MRRLLLALGSIVALLGLVATASADTAVTPFQQLRSQRCAGTDSIFAWITTKDSPLDTNSRALHAVVPTGECLLFFNRASLKLNKPVAQMKNLSFDFREPQAGGTVTGGSPRTSVILADGRALFLSADQCDHPLSVVGGDWGRADFTGFTSDIQSCTIFDSDGIAYANTPTESAWQVFVDANPNAVASFDFLIMDVGGHYFLDRITLGTGKMFTLSPKRAQNCRTEAAC
jgi:hypothetical protein